MMLYSLLMVGSWLSLTSISTIANAEVVSIAPGKKDFYLDIREIRWPEAEVNRNSAVNHSIVDCYTEMDGSFFGEKIVITPRKQLFYRSCMVRIPTHSRLFLKPTGFKRNSTYVFLIAGSSYTKMPLHTKRLHLGITDLSRWGPWHIPCDYAYLVFHATTLEETLEMRLEPEDPQEDAKDSRRDDCDDNQGRNYAMADI